ncbi:TPA: MFS transporter, partial [Klebsiella pneumoniae]|nr:MFS transporter [Klebsiella pneumoniae]
SGMLGTARLLGQSTGAALVALLFNLLGNSGTHTALLLAGTLAIVAALISGLRVTQPRAA